MPDPNSRQNSPSGHHRRTLAHIDNGKKLLNSNISPTCLHDMANFGPLMAESGSGVWGTPANFNGFRVLAELLEWSSRSFSHTASLVKCDFSYSCSTVDKIQVTQATLQHVRLLCLFFIKLSYLLRWALESYPEHKHPSSLPVVIALYGRKKE